MIKNHGGPPIRIEATGTILNPWYQLPTPVHLFRPGLSVPDEPPEITSPCRVELEEHNLRLFFRNDEVVFVFTSDSSAPHCLVDPIRYFLTYRTFVDYKLIGPATNPLDESTFDEVDRIRFKVERVVRVEETEEREGHNVVKIHHEGKDEWLEIAADSIAQYLHVLNPTLYYALAFYLIGCDNQRYFLIEFYKAVEVIRNALGGEDEFLKLLKPHGVIKGEFKQFGTYCSDKRSAPLDIGRHAPMPGVPLYSVDLRHLLVEPRSRKIYESSTLFCRQVIDAYIAFLIQQAI